MLYCDCMSLGKGSKQQHLINRSRNSNNQEEENYYTNAFCQLAAPNRSRFIGKLIHTKLMKNSLHERSKYLLKFAVR